MLTRMRVSPQVARNGHETRKELSYGKVQKHACTRLLVLPPISVARFGPRKNMMYSWAANHRPQ